MNIEDKALPLSMQITRWILTEMQSGIYKNADRLPPEVAIAAQLGVSRTVVRDALATLEREGFVSRKHGMGTIVNRHVLQVQTRIDLEKEFLHMIQDAGLTPSVDFVNVRETFANAEQAQWLNLEEGAEVVCVDRMIRADGIPAIYCNDVFSRRLIGTAAYTMDDLRFPIFDFLHRFCGVDIYMDLTQMHAVNADDFLASTLEVPKGAALLHLNERGYSIEGKLILYSSEYYRDGILDHTILRVKI